MLKKLRSFEWLTYQYRYYNEESEASFGGWIATYGWEEVTQAGSSND